MSILAIIFVDTWGVYRRLTFGDDEDGSKEKTQKEFYENLAAELIDNTYDRVGGATRRSGSTSSPSAIDPAVIDIGTGMPRCGESTHLTPTKRKRRHKDGTLTKNRYQGRCRVCGDKQFFFVLLVLMIQMSTMMAGFVILKIEKCAFQLV